MPIIGQISVGDGATFTPSVDNDGKLSWTNNKNLPNPATVDIAQAIIDAGTLAPTSNPTFTGTVTAEDITASGTITGNVTGTASGNLPLSGGTMTGIIQREGNLASGSADTSYLNIYGGTGYDHGAWFQLTGKSHTEAGGWRIQASNGNNRVNLMGKPDGTLTWNGKNVLTDNVQAINDLTTIITYNSGYSNRGGTLHLIAGFLVMMKIGVNFANSVSANTSVTIGTLASQYRPPNDSFGGGADSVVSIGSDGSIAIRPFGNKNANSWSWVTILYTLI